MGIFSLNESILAAGFKLSEEHCRLNKEFKIKLELNTVEFTSFGYNYEEQALLQMLYIQGEVDMTNYFNLQGLV